MKIFVNIFVRQSGPQKRLMQLKAGIGNNQKKKNEEIAALEKEIQQNQNDDDDW